MLSLRHSELKKGLSEGIGHARRVLQAHRHPVLAGDVPHTFDDKYVLVEGLTGAGGLAVLRCLDLLLEGRLGEAGLQELLGKTVEVDTTATLVALSQTTCTFVREQKRTEDKRTIREYFWDVKYEYEFAVQRGGGEKEAFAAVVRRRSAEVLTRTKKAPFDTTERREVGAVDLTWLLRQLAGGVVTAGVAAKMDVRFHINREVETCRTACRNKDVADAKTFFAGLARFGAAVRDEMEDVLGVQGAAAHGSFDTNADDIVVPTVPLMVDVADDDGGSAGDTDSAGALLQRGELELLVQEQERALRGRVEKLGKVEHAGSLGSGKEAGVSLVMQQISRVCRSYADSVVYVESLLRDQLVAAVGKAVSANDFAEYMSFHMRRRLQRAYAPRGLAVSVRHGNLNPEGSVVVQDKRFGCLPVPTFSRALGASVMRFDLNATTEATLEAQVNLHAFVDHQFGGSSGNVARHVQLRAEAQQFSAFVVLLGNVGGDDVFLPKHAVIVQNRDVFEIPLLLETIPSKKEFAKAVESLSPEQRAFAEAYRSMQMESTLFGMCVVQVKPHLERVLQLPAGSLTKEIQLTQDLLELFLVYNIRSDLLSQEDAAADGPDGVVLQTQADRVAQVKHHVDVVKQMLLKAKEEELAEAERRQLKRKREEEELEEDEEDYAFAKSSSCKKSKKCKTKAKRAGKEYFSSKMWHCSRAEDVTVSNDFCADPEETVDTDDWVDTAGDVAKGTADTSLSISTFPDILEQRLEAMGVDSVRPTIVKVGDSWNRTFQPGLLGSCEQAVLGEAEQTAGRAKAFGLLDSLTRSGLLPLSADMHVVVASTHSFGETLMDTLVQENVNPIAAVEASSLVVASALHETEPQQLLQN